MAIKSQYDQRKPAKFKDQHGRVWHTWVEKRTGDPCMNIMPKNWIAPVMPPQMYLKLDPETPGLVVIQYDQWERDLIDADTDWMRQCHEYGMKEYKDKFDPSAPFNIAILNKIGPRPHIPRAITPLHATPLPGAAALPVQAAKAGNLWALGLKGPNGETPKMPEQFKDFFIKPAKVVPVFTNEFEDEFEPATADADDALPDFLRPATLPRSA